MRQEQVLYMKTYVHLWYLTWFLLEWEMFYTKVVEKIKTHCMYSPPPAKKKLCHLWDNVEKYGMVRQTIYDNII
jgi:hypothetical protein